MKQIQPSTAALARAVLLTLASASLVSVGPAYAGDKTWTFDNGDTTGLTIFSNVAANSPTGEGNGRTTGGNPGGYLAITDAVNDSFSGIVFPDIDAGQLVTSFTFECDVRLGSPVSDRPADGFSINYARTGDPVLVAADANATDPTYNLRNDFAVAGAPEMGTKTGLIVSFDTWSGNTEPDGTPDVEGVVVRVDNTIVTKVPMPTRNGACDDTTSITTGPRADDASGSRDPLCWAHLKVVLDPAGKLTVVYKGKTLLDAFQTSYFPSAGRLVFAGRTGGSNENADVDNVHLTTTASAPDTTAPSAPANFKVATTTAGKVVLTWDAATDNSGRVAYTLERDGTAVSTFMQGTTFTDLGVVAGKTYSYSLVAVDPAGNKSTAASVTATTTAAAPVETNGLLFEVWNNITGTAVNLLTDDPRYQTNAPDFRALATAADTRTVYSSDAHENYGGRLSGFLVPKESGSYEFFLRSDDASQLWLSPDDKTNNLVQIAEETGCCNAFQESGSSQTSAPIALTAGNRYAIQVLWKEGGGGDYAQVAWRKAGDTTAAAALRPISGEFLRTMWDPTVGQPALTVRPLSSSVAIGGTGSMTLTAIGDQPLSYQWSLRGTNVVGATNATFTINNFALTNVGIYTVTITNVAGSVTATAGFLPKGALFVEAEDFNYGGGQYVKDKPIGMTGPYPGDAYRGLGTASDAGIDWNADGNGAQPYRADTGVDAAKENQQADWFPRGDFDVQVNNVVGWNDAGEWYNYTRNFPTPAQDYNVLGRLSSGGAPIHIQMDQVTSPATTANQTLQKLGEFNPGRATAGWDNYEFFPLVDTGGQPAVLKSWAGEKTFRMTFLTNSAGDMDYFVFVPVGGTNNPPVGGTNTFTSVTRSGNNLVLTFSSGTLESADEVTGPWIPVPNATSPVTVPITGNRKFYRLR